MRRSAHAPAPASSRKIGILDQLAQTKLLNRSPDLHVPELADVEMPSVPGLQPAKKDVARRLHQAASVHDPLPMIWVDALTGVRLQHRGARLFHLEKQVILFASRHERRRYTRCRRCRPRPP